MSAFSPFQQTGLDWVGADTPAPKIPPGSYPFQVELATGSLTRHRLNLLFALCGQADALIARGYLSEAKRLLYEAAQLEPAADFIQERIQSLP